MQIITVITIVQSQLLQNNTQQLFQTKTLFYFIYSQVTSEETGDRVDTLVVCNR